MLQRVTINSQHGMILFLVLMMLQILSLFSWVALHAILLEKKSMQAELQNHDLHNISEVILAQIENQLAQLPVNCVISEVEPTVLVNKPLAWWQSAQTCAGNFQTFQYYYVIESLGNDACAVVANTSFSADYYRITLLVSNLFLQSTVIEASNRMIACADQSHAVKQGRQSWRELNKE